MKFYILVLLCSDCVLRGNDLSVYITCDGNKACVASPDHFELDETGKIISPKTAAKVPSASPSDVAPIIPADVPATAADVAPATPVKQKGEAAGPVFTAKWDCRLLLGSTETPCAKGPGGTFTSGYLVFQFKDNKAIQVSVPIIKKIPPSEQPHLMNFRWKLFLPLLLLALPLGTLVWWQQRLQIWLKDQINSLNTSVSELRPAFPNIPGANLARDGPPVEDRAIEELTPKRLQDATISGFLRAAEAWCSTSRWAPKEIEKNRQDLGGALTLDDRARRSMFDIAEIATKYSDEEDSQKENRPLHVALDRMVEMAGLQYIDPYPNDKYDSELHSAAGPNAAAPDWSNNGRISRTIVRGLEVKGGNVVSKAKVILYG